MFQIFTSFFTLRHSQQFREHSPGQLPEAKLSLGAFLRLGLVPVLLKHVGLPGFLLQHNEEDLVVTFKQFSLHTVENIHRKHPFT